MMNEKALRVGLGMIQSASRELKDHFCSEHLPEATVQFEPVLKMTNAHHMSRKQD